MDARLVRAAICAAAILSLGASHRTPNFIINASTQQIAEQVGQAAEKYRRELAVEWLGKPMPNWSHPCPVTIEANDHLGAGGATSFVFNHGEVYDWRMTIQGPLNRILDSVLPHEVTHTIFASHFRRPLPRWADEGACTTVEHPHERQKQREMLVTFLRTGRGIPFSAMFAMKEYPRDIMPLYSQGHSLASYLIAQGGRQKFMTYLAEGLNSEQWIAVTRKHYGFNDLAILQSSWLDWVRKGSPAIQAPSETFVAQADTPRPKGTSIYRAQNADSPASKSFEPQMVTDLVPVSPPAGSANSAQTGVALAWHAPGVKPPVVAAAAPAAPTQEQASGEVRNQVTRPQGIQQPQQIILEWSKDSNAPPPPVRTSNVYGVVNDNRVLRR